MTILDLLDATVTLLGGLTILQICIEEGAAEGLRLSLRRLGLLSSHGSAHHTYKKDSPGTDKRVEPCRLVAGSIYTAAKRPCWPKARRSADR